MCSVLINCIKIYYLADLAKSEPMRPLLSNAAASEKRLECWLPRWGRQDINTPAPDAAVLPRYIREKPADLAGFSSVVDYTGKISNFLEDLRKVERLVQSDGSARYSEGCSNNYSDIGSKKTEKK